jgi:hypothetical protein
MRQRAAQLARVRIDFVRSPVDALTITLSIGSVAVARLMANGGAQRVLPHLAQRLA